MSVRNFKEFNAEELKNFRTAGKILAGIFADLKLYIHSGMTGEEVDVWVDKEIKARGAGVTYKNPEVNFPGSICISPNDVVVHGVPKDEPFVKGDLISFDLVIEVGGMKADSAFTMVIDEEAKGAKKLLISSTERSLYAGIDAIKGPIRTGDIGHAVEEVLSSAKLGIIRDLVGHGIGREMHEDPDVPNFGRRGSGTLVPAGAAIAIEPMATLGKWKVVQDDPDGWSIRTRDGSLSAHFEHTVLILEDGVEIITKL